MKLTIAYFTLMVMVAIMTIALPLVIVSGSRPGWQSLLIFGAALSLCLVIRWLVRLAYAAGRIDARAPRRQPRCTDADVARYARRLRRS